MKERLAAVGIFVAAILIIIVGIQGALGRVLACLLTPSAIAINY